MYSDLKNIKALLRLSLKHKKLFFTSLILSIILAFLGAYRPYLINIGIDRYVLVGQIEQLLFLSSIILIILILESFGRYFFSFLTEKLGLLIAKKLRINLFQTITEFKTREFDKTPIGLLSTRVINDIENIKIVYSEGLLNILADTLSILLIVIFMLFTNWQLSLICFVTLPFLIYATAIFNKKIKITFNAVRNQYAKINTFLQEHIAGIAVVQAFNAQKKESKKFNLINNDYTKANIKSVKYYAIFFPIVDIIAAAGLSLIIWWGAGSALGGKVTVGTIITFPMYLNLLYRPLRMIADKFNSLQMGLVASERVFKILNDKLKQESINKNHVKEFKGHIKFQNLDFGYDDKNLILKNINFEIKPGKSLAIVGSTGSGKSTILNLVMKFYDYNQGHIWVDGIELNTLEKHNYRSNFSLVLQDAFLFAGTIFDNISLRDPSIQLEDVVEASKMLDFHKFVIEKENGYNHLLKERGSNLSAGQKQLLALVRAMVFNRNFLILDEATSNMDVESELIIQNAIQKLLSTKTSIIVAHRLSTIRNVDEVIVIDKGSLVEKGNFDDLLKKDDGFFKKLYDRQLQNANEEA